MGFIRKAAAAVAACIVLAANPVFAAEEDSARAVVAQFQQGLLGVMKEAKDLGIKGRADRLSPIIERAFNMPVMIATAAAPYWRSATPEQRDALVGAFRNMSAASAATLFDSYAGESFRIVAERKGQGPTVLVDTEIVRPNDEPVNITYVAAHARNRWWLIDIIVGGGISELTVRRSEYQNLLREGGVANLLTALVRKSENLISGREKARTEGGGA